MSVPIDDDDDLSGYDCSPRFFSGLQSNSETGRKGQITSIVQSVRIWVERKEEDKQAANLLACHLPTVLRLSHECPLEDVRTSMGSLLDELMANGLSIPRRVHVGPSAFFSNEEVVSINSMDEQVSTLLLVAFFNAGRVAHTTQLMAYHPKYLACFIPVHHFMMRLDGPLPFYWRSYIAIMAAARHRCAYLVNLARHEFAMMDGPSEWLEGLSHIPKKLHNLSELNKLLAHQPWMIKPEHFEKLLEPGPESWSMGELVHAVVLLAHWHALAGFAFGCGIYPEIDSMDGHTHKSSTQGATAATGVKNGDTRSSSPSQAGQVESGKQMVRDITENLMQPQASDDDDATEEENFRLFENVETDPCKDANDFSSPAPCPECVVGFLEDADYEHTDFSNRGEVSAVSTHRMHEYSWEDHGFSLLNRLYTDMGPLLDEKFSCVLSLTYHQIADKQGVDTTPFRQAVWNYIHCIKGIFHDDYLYSEVNRWLTRDFKTYIKAVTCYPERVYFTSFKKALDGFLPSERVHINLLLLEARFQAELLYALRGLNRYITLHSR